MILSIVLLLFVGLIAYLHFLQGLLSGFISVVLALIATAVAMAEYEPMAAYLSGGKYDDQAQGFCLIALFAVTYLIGRLIFDKAVPGNIRVPHLVDGIGGAICGLIAGMLGTGIIAIALQCMPLRSSIAGYTRYPLVAQHSVTVTQQSGQQVDRLVIDQLKSDNIDKDEQSMLLPVDDFVVGFTKRLSDGGSLANGKPFESVHPDLMQELFGQRLGIEAGGKHTARNSEKGTQVEVVQVNVLPNTIPQTVGEFKTIWPDAPKGKKLTAEPGHTLITVSVLFKNEASDDDHLVRLSPGAVRIAYKASDGSWKNCFPIGTVQGGQAWMSRVDDFMFIDTSKEDRGANFLFDIDDNVVTRQATAAKPASGGKAQAPASATIAPDTFIEVKRLAKISLDDVTVVVGMPPEKDKFYPMRKEQFYKEKPATPEQPTETTQAPPTPTPTPTPTPAPDPTARGNRRGTPTPTPPADGGAAVDSPLVKPMIVPNPVLPVAVNVGTADADAEVVTTAAAGHITGKKFDILDVDTSSDGAAISELPKGGFAISALFTPAGKRLVQVKVDLKPGGDPWAWAGELGNFTVVDGAGASVKPSGVCAAVDKGGAPPKLLANYKANGEVTSVAKVDGATPSDIRLFFVIPADQKAKEMQYQGKGIGELEK
jgi:uncharacterized membrane protein required for colicin V production